MSGKKDAINDPNKPRLSLIPKEAIWSMANALTWGAKNYGANNFKKGIKISYLLDGALRHINEFNAGENIDARSDNNHLGNAMANLAIALYMFENKPEYDDRFKDVKEENNAPMDREYTTRPLTEPIFLRAGMVIVHEDGHRMTVASDGTFFIKSGSRIEF